MSFVPTPRTTLPLMVAALALMAGCAAPWPAPAAAPEGALGARPAAGAVEIRVGAAERTVAALEGIVAKARFELAGANVPAGTPPIEVARTQFVGGKATVRWSDLLPGTVTVKVQVFDAAGVLLGVAQGDARIEAGKTAQLALQIVPETGVATFTLDPGTEPAAGLRASFARVATGSWQVAPPMALPRAAHSLVALSGQAFAIGGDANLIAERFDPANWRWTPQSIPADRRTSHPLGAAAVLRNEIAIVGRTTEDGGKPEAAGPVFFDPFAPPFDSVSSAIDPLRAEKPFLYDLQQPRTAVGAASDGERLYMVGGSSRRPSRNSTDYAFATLNLVEVLSAGTGHWALRAPLQVARGALGAAMAGGKLYAAGGFRWKGTNLTDPLLGTPAVDSQSASMEALSAFEEYDPATDAWTARAALPTPRFGLALVAAGGRLYAIGGAGSDGVPLATVESYDPAAGAWRTEPSLGAARALLGAVTLPDGTILASGGYGAARLALRTAEAFRPEAGP